MLSLSHFFLLLILFIPSNANSIHVPSPFKVFKKKDSNNNPLPILTTFNLPSPIPTWPQGNGFASGYIDLGGLQLYQISSFNQIFVTHERGPNNLGATFFEPSSIPDGFFMLGSYAQPNNKALFGWVLVGKDLTNGALAQPIDYTLVYNSESTKTKKGGSGYVWLPIPPNGYKSVGYVVTTSPEKPPLEKIRCVRDDFTDVCESDAWIWNDNNMNFYGLKPSNRGVQSQVLSLGTFLVDNGGGNVISCLKNLKNDFSSMPNIDQVDALIKEYSPWVYFHPNEDFYPASVSWFFKNGALLYKRGDENNPVAIEPTGSNLPLNGSNDGSYWLDLPQDGIIKDQMKKGDLQDAGQYFHVKSMFGGTYTDIAVWIFYPFNGNSKAKFGPINVSLGRIGQHIGDWEHATLRVSNFDGGLKSVYFSQHSNGIWVNAADLEFQGGNKPVMYSSLHSHALQPKTGNIVIGGGGMVGLRMEAAKGNAVIDTGARFVVISAEYLGSTVVEPPWLNYACEWGPKIEYNINDELKNAERFMPGFLKHKFEKGVRGLPDELLGQEGPTGPKMKGNWGGDENI